MWRHSEQGDSQIQDNLQWRDLSFLQRNLQEEIQKTPSEVREVDCPVEQLGTCTGLDFGLAFGLKLRVHSMVLSLKTTTSLNLLWSTKVYSISKLNDG